MALNKLKKWIGTQLWSTFMTEYNENVDATNAAIDAVEAHMAESSSKHIAESGENENGRYIKFDDGTMICYIRGFRITGNDSVYANSSVPLPAAFINSDYVVTAAPTGRYYVSSGGGNSVKYFNAIVVARALDAISTFRIMYGDGSVLESSYMFEFNIVVVGRWK